jgi:hypothetical protein
LWAFDHNQPGLPTINLTGLSLLRFVVVKQKWPPRGEGRLSGQLLTGSGEVRFARERSSQARVLVPVKGPGSPIRRRMGYDVRMVANRLKAAAQKTTFIQGCNLMAQVKIYGLDHHIKVNRDRISDAIHNSVMSAFQYPPEKKIQRFIRLETEDCCWCHSARWGKQ